MLLPTSPVFWWQLWHTRKTPHLCQQILHAARFQVFRGAYILLRVLSVAESQEGQGLLEEIRPQSSVFVLSGPATVITNVATASVFQAEGWSTESVSRVARTARTRQEKHEKARAEHAYYSHMHDEVTISDAFPVTGQGLDGSGHPAENTIPEDDQEDETEQSLSDSLQTQRQIAKIHENIHQIERWYGCYVLVEPSADSSWQPPSTAVVHVRHRHVQLVQS